MLAAAMCIGSVGWAAPVSAAAQQAGPIAIQNRCCRLEFDSTTGGLTRFVDRKGPIDLVADPELAEAFRLVLTFQDGSQRYVNASSQKLSRSEKTRNGLVLYWDGPLEDGAGESHDLSVRLSATLGKSSVTFQVELENRTLQKVAEVWYPRIGGLLHFGPESSAAETIINPQSGKKLALPFGTHMLQYPGGLNMAFVDVGNAAIDRGLYIGAHDERARVKMFRFEEVKNGAVSDVYFNLLHLPFTEPGHSFEGVPLVLQFHDGDWIGAGQTYRAWFQETFGLMDPSRDWIRRLSFYQMTMIMLPEANINYTIEQVPQLAADARKYGVDAIQLAGWQRGGHDDGYPYYEPDPRLGTWEELEDAIRQCHDMGVRVYFFVNILCSMMDLDWYENELQYCNATNRKEEPQWVAGWGMGTLGSRTGTTTPLMSFVDPAFPVVHQLHLNYFKKLAEIGADGIHIDKMFPAGLNFNPRSPLPPDESAWEGAIRLIEALDRECRAINPDWRMSFECNWDRVLQFGAATWWAGNMTTARHVFPEVGETVGHYQPYDYQGINNATRSGVTVMLAPQQFNRSLDYEPWRGESEYVKQVKQIRDELAETILWGRMLGNKDVAIDPAGAADVGNWQNLATGKHGCVLTNNGVLPATLTVTAFDGNNSGPVRVYAPGKAALDAHLPIELEIPGERLVVVMEQ
jgi:hypothetical protein